MAAANPRPPRIYYVHPLAAGGFGGWEEILGHCASLGFDTVLLAPPFDPGRGGNLFLTRERDRLHPALGIAGSAADGIARLSAACRGHGLTLFLDLVIDRLAAGRSEAATVPVVGTAHGFLDPRTPPDAVSMQV